MTCFDTISCPLEFGRDRGRAVVGLGTGSVQLQLKRLNPRWGWVEEFLMPEKRVVFCLVGNYDGLVMNVNTL